MDPLCENEEKQIIMATPKNVYELAQERLDVIFREFDTICVSFSGGKDSGVLPVKNLGSLVFLLFCYYI